MGKERVEGRVFELLSLITYLSSTRQGAILHPAEERKLYSDNVTPEEQQRRIEAGTEAVAEAFANRMQDALKQLDRENC